MSFEGWLGLLSVLTTLGLGIYIQRNARRSTNQSTEVTLRGQDLAELKDVRERVAELETREQRLWAWARRHLDLYYRYRQPGAPDPEPLPDDKQ
ncbi:MAG: hypothetical protein IPJ61_20545 [Tessaracoccus sp.]|uniref:hypothetical protein n=1 Tax=Tessaracoccus sp. TaxID=1971211 RepID=UPI001EC22EC8|nr:hypothetical protein [Tessaracoccus sp.]MBK7823378.1 hypothetical protein [Tessaracoccus sp.]